MQNTTVRSLPIRSLFAAAVLACCATVQAQWKEAPVQGAVAASSREAQDARFREAIRLHRAGRWSAAYGRFVALADEGHVPAARVALEMLRNGRNVYGTDWGAAPLQVAGWERAVGARGAMDVALVGE
ncbi:MAG: hypothetical protein JWQ76_176 [Ramlibacter sp.]|nr:hypothetical protein [Ramlibacter sp.]